MKAHFDEVQQFRQPWLFGLLGVLLYIVIKSQALADPPRWVGLAVGGGIIVAVSVFIYFCKVIIRVDNEGIHTQFWPLEKEKLVPPHEIEHSEIAVIRPLLDHGGWGLRVGRKGRSYIVSGTDAVVVTLRDGKKLTLGTQKQVELASAINRLLR